MNTKLLSATLAAAIAAEMLLADNIPAPREVTLRPRLGRENVEMRLASGETVRPSEFVSRISLAGQWKFRGLDRQATPFGPVTDAERTLLSPETDDADWESIAVPFNWWADPRFPYGNVFDKDEIYFRGYYRRTIDVPDPNDGKRRILRFCEKRFVCWERPENHPNWDVPSVLEQYSCFIPIDASSAKMIRAYLALWRATGEPEQLAKARTLGDTITRVQTPEGRIPTFWTHDILDDPLYDWLNCMGSSAAALLELDDAVWRQ